MERFIRISILSDRFDKISWDIFDWKNEYTQILYKELINSVETINNLMENNSKLMLTSSLELGVDILFSHMAIDLQKRLGRDKIITRVAISYLNQGISYSDVNSKRYKEITQSSDLIIFLSDKISAREEIEKSKYWRIDNSDYLIMVSNDRDSELIKYARNKKLPIFFIRPKNIIDIVSTRDKILEYAYPLIYKDNYAGVVVDTSKKIIFDYTKNLLGLELNFKEDRNLSEDSLFKKYSLLSLKISKSLVKFNDFVFTDRKID